LKTKELYRVFLDSPGVTTDSRVSAPGKIFFALRGEKFDGNSFARQAIKNGCSMAVIDDPGYVVPRQTILVNNVLSSLQQLACYHRQQFSIPVLAITGSNGKTTTKELVREVLSSRYRTLATRGNLNNHIGVPVTLLELNEDHQFAVIEMGANHIGEIETLCTIAMPDHGLITNIGSAHLEGFGSPEGVRKAKSELYRYLKRTGGKAFLNSDRPDLVELSEEISLDFIPYGAGEENFLTGSLLASDEKLELEIKTRKFSKSLNLKTQMAGDYNVENIIAAACIGAYFGASPGQIKEAVENYIPANNRSQITLTNKNKLLLDAYNANPDSMMAAIKNFAAMPGENKSVILGDMLELGQYATREHEKIIQVVDQYDFREVMLVGKLFYDIPAAGRYLKFKNTEQLTAWLTDNPVTGRFILLKGSRGIGLEKCSGVL
jgi:UDP-N-acetylmuramoyl-tripeptide--D-alanyl-D-alanine ligase